MKQWIFILLLFGVSCKKTVPEAWKIVCYQFDQRQCETDEWAKKVKLSFSSMEKKEKMMTYLQSKGLEIIRVGYDPKFHSNYCEACDTCPYAHRFYIEMNDKNLLILKRLRLLNLESCDCTSF